MNLNDIVVSERLRPLNAEWVAELERSIAAIGLRTPISIRFVDDKPTLVAGAHRLQAVKNLGWNEIPVHEFDGDDRAARMWEIAENLHRAELTVLERSEQLAEWIRLAAQSPAQDAPVKSRREDGRGGSVGNGINQAARELGVERTDAQRAVKVDSLSDEAKETAVELGLDDNRSALLDAAKAKTAEEQVEVLKQRKERKRSEAKDQPVTVVEPTTPSEPANITEGADTGSPERPTLTGAFRLLDLPFDEALAQFKTWYAGLTITEQQQVEAAMGKVNEVAASEQPLGANVLPFAVDTTAVTDVDNADDTDPDQPELDPQPRDRVGHMTARLNALPGARPKWCRERLDKPEDAIKQLQGNAEWKDAMDWLISFLASSAADQAAIRAAITAPAPTAAAA